MCNDKYYLAIDGGGTKTQFLLTDGDGTTIREIVLGPSNPVNVGMEASQRLLHEGIDKICDGFDKGQIVAFAGIAGGITGNNKEVFAEFFNGIGFKKVGNSSDAYNSLALGLGNDDGIILIMGTGIMGFAVKNGKEKRIAGWGTLFDSGGCGYTLGRDAIYAALCESDGTGEATHLTSLIEKKMGTSVPENLGNIYLKGKDYIASFAPYVTQAAQLGDKVACNILERNMKRVSEIINSVVDYIATPEIKLALTGGLITQNPQLVDMISKELDSRYHFNINIVDEKPIYGALKIAKELDINEKN